MSNDLLVLDTNEIDLGMDQTQIAELTQTMMGGFGVGFARSARIKMSNGGDWELITEDGEAIDLGREVNLVIVDQREFVSRVHYAKTYDANDVEASGPDCQSYDGITPDKDVQNPLSDKCKGCNAFEKTGLKCGMYRRIVGVLAYEDGTFSDPFIFEPKALSLFDETVVGGRFGSYAWYMRSLASQKRNGQPFAIPTQAIVTQCKSKPKAEVSTIKFGIAPNADGGYWVLSKEQREEILALRDSDKVKDMLKPFQAQPTGPQVGDLIEVTMIEDKPSAPVEKVVEDSKPAPTKKAPPAPKKPEPKPAPEKKAPPAPKKKTVVLGIEHPDVKNSEDFDYEGIVEWAKDADPADVKEWLAENFPQALEPVVLADEKPAPEKKAPVKKAPPTPKKAEPAPEASNVVAMDGNDPDPELAKTAELLAGEMDNFDD